MAEGPRSKRRKQANPRRKNAICLSEDKQLSRLSGAPPFLTPSQQEQEEETLQEPLSWRFDERSDEFDGGETSLHPTGNTAVIQLDGLSNINKFLLNHKLEDGDAHQAFATYLRQKDTAIIYPEAPEEASAFSPPETHGPDESEHDMAAGVLDDFPQMLTCPYCQRGYKRLSSLKEHIMYRHQKNEGSFSCSFCSHTFTNRVQLERHMTRHQPPNHQLLLSDPAGNRKFKCNECGKAFKYKHHLKEHLRIHSGEKPYECSNCKKRFSHSGSYSSHISSKKCISLTSLNGRVHNDGGSKPSSSPNSSSSSPGSPALNHLHSRSENGRLFSPPDIQRSLDIKTEPMDFSEYQMLMSSQLGFGGSGTYMNGHGEDPLRISTQSLFQHLGGTGVDLSLLGYTGPLKNNLSEVRKLLQIVDKTACRQKMDGYPELSKLNAHTKEQGTHMAEHKSRYQLMDSPTRSIIDYTLEKVNEAKCLIDDSKRQVDIKKEKMNQEDLSSMGKLHDDLFSFSCQYCKETFTGPIPLHQHERYMCKMNDEIKAVLQPENTPPNRLMSPELPSNERATSPVNLFEDHMSVLKAYFAMKTEPNSEELLKISIAVGLNQEIVREWFEQWKSQSLPSLKKKSTTPDCGGPDIRSSSCPSLDSQASSNTNQSSAHRPVDSLDHLPPQSSTLSPLNLSSVSSKNPQSSSYPANSLTSEEFHRDFPLDLSLSKHMMQKLISAEAKPPRPNGLLAERSIDISAPRKTSGPLDSINIKTEVVGPDGVGNSAHPLEKASSPFFGMNTFAGCPTYTSLPHHGAFPPPTFMTPAPATIPGIRPYSNLDPMSFLPHMAYTYTAGASSFNELQQRRKFQQKPAFQGELLQAAGLDELTDSESLLCRKKMKKTDSGMYACDLCDKTFQKTSSLLRHKYEHTGKRPHQCQICQKAFKHKHHLIEHSRLHSGEKPYQCDKCGKRFSHSGSYSQHMNHRYSYCKREAEEREAAQREAQHSGGDLEPTELLMGRTYLQALAPLRQPRPDDRQETWNTSEKRLPGQI
ncbi:zinc finger E-box-binding homeobox 2-like [Salarias fasciatus]|uniref:zinc finger E-box-binding homeobox 2-like n=1 Tax=Salarias fasciatus TaxID=181472 RepID=UPI001176D42D|nr:zinc finger E-box-binding homeobox 2-like [Salarias fasciatus]